jgi:hypothetical protein
MMTRESEGHLQPMTAPSAGNRPGTSGLDARYASVLGPRLDLFWVPWAVWLVEPIQEHPIAWGLGAVVVAALPTLAWLGYTRRIRVDRDAVRVTRGFRPFPRRYPRLKYDRILRMQRFVYLKRGSRFSIVNPSLSPSLRSEDEARWVAWVLRRALRH